MAPARLLPLQPLPNDLGAGAVMKALLCPRGGEALHKKPSERLTRAESGTCAGIFWQLRAVRTAILWASGAADCDAIVSSLSGLQNRWMIYGRRRRSPPRRRTWGGSQMTTGSGRLLCLLGWERPAVTAGLLPPLAWILKNLVITISHEVQELCRDLSRRRYGEYARQLTR